METVGEYLQRHRKAIGYTIEDVARITRINPHYLKAIEENDYNKLPAPAFTQGFLRSYAKLLSLDEKDVIRRLPPPSPPQPRKGMSPASHPEGEKLFPFGAWTAGWERWRSFIMAGFAFAAVIGVTALIFRVGGEKKTPLSSPAVEKVMPVGSGNTEVPLAEPQEVPPQEVAKGETMVLTFVAKEESWLRVVLDGTDIRSILLPEGGQIQWKAKEKYWVILGNAGGVEANLDGKPLGAFGKSGQVVKGVLITREGVSSVPLPPSASVP